LCSNGHSPQDIRRTIEISEHEKKELCCIMPSRVVDGFVRFRSKVLSAFNALFESPAADVLLADSKLKRAKLIALYPKKTPEELHAMRAARGYRTGAVRAARRRKAQEPKEADEWGD
jgi:hypothetical protein